MRTVSKSCRQFPSINNKIRPQQTEVGGATRDFQSARNANTTPDRILCADWALLATAKTDNELSSLFLVN